MQNRNFVYKDKNGNTVKVNMYTYFLQEFGNRIRHHGDISSDKEFTENNMFALAKRVTDFIKAIRYFNKQDNAPTFIYLDAIRNPYEATYFQDRYAAFFLVSVSTDDTERIRLLGENYDNQQIKALY